jgi:hypothetical protein
MIGDRNSPDLTGHTEKRQEMIPQSIDLHILETHKLGNSIHQVNESGYNYRLR